MVIAHGSGGILAGREDAWAARLNGLGIATFVVDSFAPRGLSSTARDQSRLSTMANLADALAALKLLATHPRIDPARIGVMGFSRGGQVALYSSLEPLRHAARAHIRWTWPATPSTAIAETFNDWFRSERQLHALFRRPQ